MIWDLLNEIETVLPSLIGWCNLEKARRLAELVALTRPALCVEIGVHGGKSLIPIALAARATQCGRVVGIDPWDRDAATEGMVNQANIDHWTRTDYEKVRQECAAAITRLDLSSWCQLIRAKAHEVVDRFSDGSIGLLHLDGNHSAEPVKRDVKLWLPKVAIGGLIVLDDIGWSEGDAHTVRAGADWLLANGCETFDDSIRDCAILRRSRKTVRLYRWVPNTGENLGDWLSVPILRALGLEPIPPVAQEPCLFMVGSILHPTHYALPGAAQIIVWGSGIGCGDPPPAGVTLDFRAVRGPMTRRILGLPENMPLGDPALLLPKYVRLPEAKHRGEVLYVNHVGTQPPNCPDGFDAGVSTHVAKTDGLDLVARIAAAKFVASESLHGCILAAAYGVPWSPCSSRIERQWTRIGEMSKWNDWLEYLGLPHLPAFPKTLDDALAWWKTVGQRGRLRSLEPMLDAFPFKGFATLMTT